MIGYLATMCLDIAVTGESAVSNKDKCSTLAFREAATIAPEVCVRPGSRFRVRYGFQNHYNLAWRERIRRSIRRQERNERFEQQAILDTCLQALGMAEAPREV